MLSLSNNPSHQTTSPMVLYYSWKEYFPSVQMDLKLVKEGVPEEKISWNCKWLRFIYKMTAFQTVYRQEYKVHIIQFRWKVRKQSLGQIVMELMQSFGKWQNSKCSLLFKEGITLWSIWGGKNDSFENAGKQFAHLK